MQENFDEKRIAGTLKYGLLHEKSIKYLYIDMSVIIVLLVAIMIIGDTLLAVYMSKGTIYIVTGICSIVLVSVAILAGIVLLLLFIKRCINRRKEILLWTVDSVALKAYSSKIAENDNYDGFPVNNKEYRIQIGFKYNGNHYKVKSNTARHWRDFIDREINILYSPKYDEVILLK